MELRDLGRLDLNLLVALEALLEERSVSRAAQRLYITQSAMSKTLGRLRDLFDDPLFIRRGAAMVPTPRAEQLATYLPEVLAAVQAMVEPPEFDPLTFEGKVRLLVEGHLGVWAVPRLLQRLNETAPNLLLRTITGADNALEQLASGELDMVLHGERQHYPGEYRLTTLGFAPPRILARAGHPLQGQEITWEALLEYPQVQLHIPELLEIEFHAPEDSSFIRRAAQVTPQLRTDHLYTAIRVVLETDYVFPAPPLFMEAEELARELIALPLPDDEELNISYVLVSHKRVERSGLHRFLHSEILTVVDEFRARMELPPLAEMRRLRKLSY